MPVPAGFPVVDHHCHLSPSGEGVAAARRFRAGGGTHLFLATQAYTPEVPRDLSAYADQFDITERLAETVRREAGVVVQVVLAPFPVDLVHQSEILGLDAAEALHREALDLAARRIREHRAIALGEVGWPHFEVDTALRAAADRVFRHALGAARDADCPVVVHSPDLDAAGYRELGAVADACGLARARVVKHYARTPVSAADRGGIAASYVASRDLVDAALTQEGNWFLETDFLDDPRRPGAVLDLATIPRRAASIAARGSEWLERLRIPFESAVRRVYGLSVTVEAPP